MRREYTCNVCGVVAEKTACGDGWIFHCGCPDSQGLVSKSKWFDLDVTRKPDGSLCYRNKSCESYERLYKAPRNSEFAGYVYRKPGMGEYVCALPVLYLHQCTRTGAIKTMDSWVDGCIVLRPVAVRMVR